MAFLNLSRKVGGHELYVATLPLMTSNMFLLCGSGRALLIDPSESAETEHLLEERGITDLTALLTHEHFDHISGVNRCREWADAQPRGTCMVYASRACAEMIPNPDKSLSRYFMSMFIGRTEEDRELAAQIFRTDYSCDADVVFDGETELDWENLHLVLREMPGHSPGSICIEIWTDGTLAAVATGDSLVQGNKVITRLPGGNKQDYREVTRPYLESIPGDTLILPGHGAVSLMKELELG